MLNLVPPVVLVVLNACVIGAYARRFRDTPHPATTWVCAVAPVIYGLGALLYLLGDEWLPGVALAGLGTLAIPPAVLMAVLPQRRVHALFAVGALLTWIALWLSRIDGERIWTRRAAELVAAGYLATVMVTILVAFLRSRTQSGIERRLVGAALPCFAVAVIYLLLKPEGFQKPIVSTSVQVGGELVLLMLVTHHPSGLATDPRGDVDSRLSLVFQVLLLALGALLILVLATNLGLFPRESNAFLVAMLLSTGMAVGYGLVRPRLDVFLRTAFFPELHQAQQRASALQGELESTRERLRRAEHLSLVGQLAAKVAHEIKNPLGPIKGYAKIIEREVLKQGALTEVVQRGLEIIRQEVETIDGRARGLLELSRPPQPQLQDLDYAELAQDVIDLTAGEAPPGVSVGWREQPAAAPGRSDPVLLRGALTNLVQNALQALTESGTKGAVILRLERDAHEPRWILTVDDDGPGLPPDVEPEALFQPFVSHKPGGHGLGLMIARGSLQSLGGDLSLERRPEGGARAVLRLPLDEGASSSGDGGEAGALVEPSPPAGDLDPKPENPAPGS
jgi:signal transduction histidine kinase